MKIGKIYVKFNFYKKDDDITTNEVIKSDKTQYGTLTFDNTGKLVDWSVDKDLLKQICDQADRERHGEEQADTFNFCWEHSIKNKTDYGIDTTQSSYFSTILNYLSSRRCAGFSDDWMGLKRKLIDYKVKINGEQHMLFNFSNLSREIANISNK
jgi:hypothetical protein